jgi:hypothetical protein
MDLKKIKNQPHGLEDYSTLSEENYYFWTLLYKVSVL